MSLNPLNVLKRKLEDETIPLPKRLRLAKNIIHTHYFPAAPKERIVAEWLEVRLKKKKISGDEFRNILGWLNSVEDCTAELKSKLIELSSEYVQNNTLQDGDIPCILSFLENEKISIQLSSHIDEYCLIIKTILNHLQTDLTAGNINHAKRIFKGLIKYYKESKKKLLVIDKFLNGDNLETLFDYLDYTDCRQDALSVCQTLLFPMSKKSFFTAYFRTLLQKESFDELLEEKGDNIQAVLKTMEAFFAFPSGRTKNNHRFLKYFIDAFVNSFKTESHLIFAFYIMVSNCLSIEQSYVSPAMNMPGIQFEKNNEKVKRNLFLNMLKFLLENEVDLSTKLTETLSGNKGHIKKDFTSFLKAVLVTQLKLEGKPDKTTLEIIIASLKLDPILVESKLDKILPPLMVAKKTEKTAETFISMMNCLLDILFKLGKGITFVNQLLPHLRTALETVDDAQIALQNELKSGLKNDVNTDEIKTKILVGTDLLPKKCVEMFGKLSSELMFRQNNEFLMSLQKDFEEYCLSPLENGDKSPSTTILAQFLAAILWTFFEWNKMADHTVPQQIAEEFWTVFEHFEGDVLARFGKILLTLDEDQELFNAFLKLSLRYAQLKLLNHKYSHVKIPQAEIEGPLPVFDLHFLLPCLGSEQWTELCEKIVGFNNDGVVLADLLLLKISAVELLSLEYPTLNAQELNSATKTYLIKHFFQNSDTDLHANLHKHAVFPRVGFVNLDGRQMKKLTSTLLSYPEVCLDPTERWLETTAVANNRPLLNALTMRTLKNITTKLASEMELESLEKAISKDTFDAADYVAETKNFLDLFKSICEEKVEDDDCTEYVEVLMQLQLPYLEEKYQLAALLVLLILKSVTTSKKTLRRIDELLRSVFELSPKHPDLYKLFPVEYIFDFENKTFIKLLTLNIQTSNPLLLIKCLLETAVKKVKTNAEVVKILVKILLTNQKVKKEDASNIEYFSDVVFQISCLILPIIAKEKKAITNSAFRTILAELQEKLHKALLKSFKSINLHNEKSQFLEKAGNPEDSVTVNENTMATLDAMEAFSLTLSKYCETTDAEDIKNLDYLWSGLEFFVENAIRAIQDQKSKPHHVESSIHLLNVTLRNIKKLETHNTFKNRDRALVNIWQSVKARLLMIFQRNSRDNRRHYVHCSCLEEIGVTVKLLSELTSVDGFIGNFIGDLFNLMILKKPPTKYQEQLALLTSHKVARYLWTNCLGSNVIERKCLAMSKTIYRTCKNLTQWLRQNYEQSELGKAVEEGAEEAAEVVKIDDNVCEVLKIDLEILAEVIMAAKKIPLNYKFLDAIFEVQHLTQFAMGLMSMRIRCEVSWQSYFKLFEGSISVLNSLLMSREELLEDRWPCYMQSYRSLVASLCLRASSQTQPDRHLEEKLVAIGHSIEKLTQSICKRKAHVSRLAAYTVADICACLEKNGPTKAVRQHLENSIALLIQVSDSNYAMAFLRRGLAGAPGQMTMTNMYTMYKRYHKYVGNA